MAKRPADSAANDAPVPSPCTKVCVLDAAAQQCRGCLRHVDEIAGWAAMDDDRRREVLRRVAARRAATRPGPAGGLDC